MWHDDNFWDLNNEAGFPDKDSDGVDKESKKLKLGSGLDIDQGSNKAFHEDLTFTRKSSWKMLFSVP